ncbi:MAG TPA: hypothetical protein VFC13_06600 [Actinomycetes bacterium]|nr:hypothetical protein [Actinomycetes bacterium]
MSERTLILRLTLDLQRHPRRPSPAVRSPDRPPRRAGRQGQVGLWITTAFGNDQERAPADKHQRNLAWLSERPLIGTVPGGFRLDYSRLGIDTVLLSDEQATIVRTLDEILLPKRFQVGNLRADDEAAMAKWRRKVTDVQHLTAHLIAGHDAFVTSDDDDMLKKRADLQARTGIVVVNPAEAVQMAHGQAA